MLNYVISKIIIDEENNTKDIFLFCGRPFPGPRTTGALIHQTVRFYLLILSL